MENYNTDKRNEMLANKGWGLSAKFKVRMHACYKDNGDLLFVAYYHMGQSKEVAYDHKTSNKSIHYND